MKSFHQETLGTGRRPGGSRGRSPGLRLCDVWHFSPEAGTGGAPPPLACERQRAACEAGVGQAGATRIRLERPLV